MTIICIVMSFTCKPHVCTTVSSSDESDAQQQARATLQQNYMDKKWRFLTQFVEQEMDLSYVDSHGKPEIEASLKSLEQEFLRVFEKHESDGKETYRERIADIEKLNAQLTLISNSIAIHKKQRLHSFQQANSALDTLENTNCQAQVSLLKAELEQKSQEIDELKIKIQSLQNAQQFAFPDLEPNRIKKSRNFQHSGIIPIGFNRYCGIAYCRKN